MRVRTETSQTFDFGLNGRETQESFNLEKYRALAYHSPLGVKLSELVEDKWLDWVQIVDEAPWLSNWKKSPYLMRRLAALNCKEPAVTPLGALVEPGHQSHIALKIYTEAIWGYGVFGWLTADTKADGKISADTKANSALKALYGLQGVKCPNAARTYLIDNPIYRGTGLIVPCEFGDLDRWLEPMWFELCQAQTVEKLRG